MNLVVDADRVLADLKELHERHGGPGGARRLAWSEDWLAAREWFQGKLDELDGITVDRDEAGNVWAELRSPRDSASPMPSTCSTPSSLGPATIHVTLLVPMSRPIV